VDGKARVRSGPAGTELSRRAWCRGPPALTRSPEKAHFPAGGVRGEGATFPTSTASAPALDGVSTAVPCSRRTRPDELTQAMLDIQTPPARRGVKGSSICRYFKGRAYADVPQLREQDEPSERMIRTPMIWSVTIPAPGPISSRTDMRQKRCLCSMGGVYGMPVGAKGHLDGLMFADIGEAASGREAAAAPGNKRARGCPRDLRTGRGQMPDRGKTRLPCGADVLDRPNPIWRR